MAVLAVGSSALSACAKQAVSAPVESTADGSTETDSKTASLGALKIVSGTGELSLEDEKLNVSSKEGEEMYGQEIPYNTVEINSKAYEPKITAEFMNDSAIYHVGAADIKTTFDVVWQIKGVQAELQYQSATEKLPWTFLQNRPMSYIKAVQVYRKPI